MGVGPSTGEWTTNQCVLVPYPQIKVTSQSTPRSSSSKGGASGTSPQSMLKFYLVCSSEALCSSALCSMSAEAMSYPEVCISQCSVHSLILTFLPPTLHDIP